MPTCSSVPTIACCAPPPGVERSGRAQVVGEEVPDEQPMPLDTTVAHHPAEHGHDQERRAPHEHRHDTIERGLGVGTITREHEVDRDERDVPPDRQTHQAPHVEHEPQDLGEAGRGHRGHADLDHVGCRTRNVCGRGSSGRSSGSGTVRRLGGGMESAGLEPPLEVDVDRRPEASPPPTRIRSTRRRRRTRHTRRLRGRTMFDTSKRPAR